LKDTILSSSGGFNSARFRSRHRFPCFMGWESYH